MEAAMKKVVIRWAHYFSNAVMDELRLDTSIAVNNKHKCNYGIWLKIKEGLKKFILLYMILTFLWLKNDKYLSTL